jgi:hypothetical protein
MFVIRQLPKFRPDVAVRRLLPALASVIGVMATCPVANAQFLRWEIEATVVQIDEPQGVLNEVRLGDPVRGWLNFHLAIVPDANSSSASYTHPAMFQVTRMIIDNPRTGEEIAFEGANDSSAYHNVDVYDDLEDGDDIIDYIIAIDDVLPPPGLEADLPVTAVEIKGSSDVLQDLSLPRQLHLADWPLAILSYNDLLGGAAVYAEIFSLTPVEVTSAASDFDFDGDVDASDLQVWMAHFGSDGYPDADADFDYDADGADFLTWQRQLGGMPTNAAATAVVPEPATLLLVASGAFAMMLRRRLAVS